MSVLPGADAVKESEAWAQSVWIFAKNEVLIVWIFAKKCNIILWIITKNEDSIVWKIKKSYLCNFKNVDIMYFERSIDKYLQAWAEAAERKPILLRGARQVGKSTAVSHLGRTFKYFVEINFERQPEYMALFSGNLIVDRIVSQISAISGVPIIPGETLLFLDEIQLCKEAIMSLRFFKEEKPDLHVIAAGSLLEFAIEELPSFGVGRIHSMFMYPMTFDEFLSANGMDLLLKSRNEASADNPLPAPIHEKLIEIFRTYLLIGGMPEVVYKWVKTYDYLQCQEIQDDLLIGYEDDFPKYKKKVNPLLLKMTLQSVALQVTQKFSYAAVGGGFSSAEIKKALEMLILAGLCVPVVRTDANGLPLGSGADLSYRKILLFDPGIMLRILNMTLGDVKALTTELLTQNVSELVNKGPLAEMVAGLELQRYHSPNLRHSLYFWTRNSKNSQAKIDYVEGIEGKVIPIEVKAGMRGGMKSLWIFMREKALDNAARCSLENFGFFEYKDEQSGNTLRRVTVCPLYAMSMLKHLLVEMF